MTIVTLNSTTATQPAVRKRPSARSGPAQLPGKTARMTRRLTPTGKPWTRGSHGAPAAMRMGAKNMIRMCSIMWAKK